jgi:hypothetical protein
MNGSFPLICLLASVLSASPVSAEELLLLEWADQGVQRDTIGNDPIYKRMLFCQPGAGPLACDMYVLAIGRQFCPLITDVLVYSTAARDLRAFRRGDNIEIDLVELKADTKLRLKLKNDNIGGKMVEQASGVMVFRPVGDEKVTTAELAGIVLNTKGMENYPQHAEVDLKCSKLSVTAAKKTAPR